jgi:mannose/fructose/N-acetylgalactosamine-specific phosphotransferase system component IIB
MKSKKVYMFFEDGKLMQTLFLSEEQAAVFKWLKNYGYELDIQQIDEESPEEIIPEKWITM